MISLNAVLIILTLIWLALPLTQPIHKVIINWVLFILIFVWTFITYGWPIFMHMR